MRVLVVAVLLLLLSGCAAPTGPTSSTGAGPEPEASLAPLWGTGLPLPEARQLLNVSVTRDGRDIVLLLHDRLSPGRGVLVVWPFAAPRDSFGESSQVSLTACGGTSLDQGPSAIYLAPSLLQGGSGNMTFDSFDGTTAFTQFDVLYGATATGRASGSGSSEPAWTGFAVGIVAMQGACVDLSVRLNATTMSGTEPLAAVLDGTISLTMGSPERQADGFVHNVTSPGWTHVQRAPLCDQPVHGLAPNQLVQADVAFPNGYAWHGGPFMNGIFPGPTVDAPTFFGTFADVPGDLDMRFVGGVGPECILVVEAPLDMPLLAHGQSGYTDSHQSMVPA